MAGTYVTINLADVPEPTPIAHVTKGRNHGAIIRQPQAWVRWQPVQRIFPEPVEMKVQRVR
jgi:hypothetical protein